MAVKLDAALPEPAHSGRIRGAMLNRLVAPIVVLFFFSGLASLIYQVIWMRHLSLFFGSDVYSAAFTLSAFMGGLSLGGLAAVRFADRLKNTLIWYGALELGIGIYALFFIDILDSFQGANRQLYLQYFDAAPWVYQLFRVTVAFVTLLIPTTMMGATLPLIVRRFVQEEGTLGRYTATFYAVNTLGAFVGVISVGFFLLPNLGMRSTIFVAFLINLAVGVLALWIGSRSPQPSPRTEETGATVHEGFSSASYNPLFARAALIAISISGMAALALEVVWMRVLTLSFSGTAYSFSIMLSCFLFGIFYGSRRIAPLIDRASSPMRILGFLEFGLGGSVVVLGILTYVVPGLFAKLLGLFTRVAPGEFGFAFVVAQFLVSALLISVPTMLLGATFPVAVKICTPDVLKAGRGTGGVYAANTAGGIVGALLSAFVLIPSVGSRNGLVVIALIFAANGLFLLMVFERGLRPVLADWKLASSLAGFGVAAVVVVLLPNQTVTNFNMQGDLRLDVIFHGEGISHTVDIVRNEKKETLLMIDGNPEAGTTYWHSRHFILKGHLPLLLHPAPKEVVVIGLGLGVTLAATERHPGIERIQLVELTPDMLEAHRHLEDVTHGILERSKVDVRIDDGRNFLAMTDRSFDMITADPIHPKIAGVGYLYTKEYYELIRRALKPDGIVCQWMPIFQISPQSFDVAFRTFAEVFPHASFWYVEGNGLFVATKDRIAIDYLDLQKRLSDPDVSADLLSIGIGGAEELLSHLLLGPEQIQRYLGQRADSSLNTDDNAYLEYHTPFELLETGERVMAGLVPFAGFDEGLIRNMPDARREELSELLRIRRSEIVPNLRKRKSKER